MDDWAEIALVVVSVLLALLLVATAVQKLSHSERVVAMYARVGVPEERLNALAALLLAAAVGLVVGLFWAPVGVGVAAGLVAYFAAAVGAHVRFSDTAHLLTPVVYAALAVAALVLRLATL
jgi:DoxX-like family